MSDLDIECTIINVGNNGDKHICKDFTEEKCLSCQAAMEYNRLYSFICNDVIQESKRVNGNVKRVLKPKFGLSNTKKRYIKVRLLQMASLKEVIL